MDSTIEYLTSQITELEQSLFTTRQQALSIFLAFLHAISEQSNVEPSWFLCYILQNDRSVLELDSIDDWPPHYQNSVNDFLDLLDFYTKSGETEALRDVIKKVASWPIPKNESANLH